jgi:hypothetical protein
VEILSTRVKASDTASPAVATKRAGRDHRRSNHAAADRPASTARKGTTNRRWRTPLYTGVRFATTHATGAAARATTQRSWNVRLAKSGCGRRSRSHDTTANAPSR